MHVFAIGFGLITSLAALFMDLYHNADLWCWIASYPSDCVGDECVRARDDFVTFQYAFFFVPLWVCALFTTGVMISINRTVRRREYIAIEESKKAERGDRSSVIRSSLKKATSQKNVECSKICSSVPVIFHPGNQLPASDSSVQQKEAEQQSTPTRTRKGRRPSRPVIGPYIRAVSSTAEQRPSMIMPKKMAEMLTSMSQADLNKCDESDVEFVLKTIESLPSAGEQAVEMNSFGSRAVYMQAFYYTCAFYTTYTFATVNQLVQQATGETYFPIALLHAMLIPLQGLFNGQSKSDTVSLSTSSF
jgi:hypothetical protein